MAYSITYKKQAIEDAKKLKIEEPKAFQKLLKLEAELKEHPLIIFNMWVKYCKSTVYKTSF